MRTLALILLLLLSSHAGADVHPVNYNPVQVDCLARNIYFEARGESIKGQFAVAHVTLNRVSSKDYPNNICDVVKQYKQFSWYTGPASVHIDWMDEREVRAWRDVQTLARQFVTLYKANQLNDPTLGALFYHAAPMPDGKPYPYWAKSMTKTVTIEGHRFYTK